MEETPGCGLPSRGPTPQEFPVSFAQNNEIKERIRESVDIAELVGSYMELRRQGPNYVGICPWHNDTKPSFNVTPSRKTWRCWVCNVGGDIFSFVEKYEGVEFFEAFKMLADRAGIEIPKTGGGYAPPAGETREKKRSFLKILEWAEECFHEMLVNDPAGAPAREYLEQRGFTSESIQRYRIGFSRPGWSWLLDLSRDRKFDEQSLVDVGLIKRHERGHCYDFFRGRVMFPIHDLTGRTIAFGGRVLPQDADGTAKYLNSPDTPLFKKRSQLYGLDVVRGEFTKSRSVTVMEGYTDVVMARQLGVMDPVAVLGTALGEGHIKLLQHHVNEVTLVLDGDEAGRKRSNEILNLFISQKLDLRVLTLPDELDPCDYIMREGVEAFDALRSQAPDALEQKLQNELRGIDPLRDTHRGSVALENILEAVALIPRANDRQGTKELLVLSRLARTFQVNEGELRKRLAAKRSRSKTKKWVEEEPAVVEAPPAALPESERELLEILLLAPELAEVVVAEVGPDSLRHARCRALFETIGGCVAKVELPDFETLLAAIDTLEEKSVLVEIDDQARAKAETATSTPFERWQIWLEARLHAKHRQNSAEKRQLLNSKSTNEMEAMNVLQALLEERRGFTKSPDKEE